MKKKGDEGEEVRKVMDKNYQVCYACKCHNEVHYLYNIKNKLNFTKWSIFAQDHATK